MQCTPVKSTVGYQGCLEQIKKQEEDNKKYSKLGEGRLERGNKGLFSEEGGNEFARSKKLWETKREMRNEGPGDEETKGIRKRIKNVREKGFERKQN